MLANTRCVRTVKTMAFPTLLRDAESEEDGDEGVAAEIAAMEAE